MKRSKVCYEFCVTRNAAIIIQIAYESNSKVDPQLSSYIYNDLEELKFFQQSQMFCLAYFSKYFVLKSQINWQVKCVGEVRLCLSILFEICLEIMTVKNKINKYFIEGLLNEIYLHFSYLFLLFHKFRIILYIYFLLYYRYSTIFYLFSNIFSQLFVVYHKMQNTF